MMPDGSPRGAGSASDAASTAAALTSERFAGAIILITGAHNVTDYSAAHTGRPQSLPHGIIILIQFAGGFTKVPHFRDLCPKYLKLQPSLLVVDKKVQYITLIQVTGLNYVYM